MNYINYYIIKTAVKLKDYYIKTYIFLLLDIQLCFRRFFPKFEALL